MKFNYKFFITFLLLLTVEVIIAIFIQNNFIRSYIGDVIVIILIYFAIRSFFSIKSRLLPIYIFAFAVLVEMLQYINIVKLLGLENITLIRIVIGTTFDIKDIICYFVGCVILMIVSTIILSKQRG